jgi:hypothetical protein
MTEETATIFEAVGSKLSDLRINRKGILNIRSREKISRHLIFPV